MSPQAVFSRFFELKGACFACRVILFLILALAGSHVFAQAIPEAPMGSDAETAENSEPATQEKPSSIGSSESVKADALTDALREAIASGQVEIHIHGDGTGPLAADASAAVQGEAEKDVVPEDPPASAREILSDLKRDAVDFFSLEAESVPYKDIGISLFIILVSFLLRHVIAKWFFARLSALASRTKATWDDKLVVALERPLAWFIFVFGVFLAVVQLPIGDRLHGFTVTGFKLASLIILFWALLCLNNVLADILVQVSNKKKSSVGAFVPLLRKTLRFFIIMVGIVLLLENIGYDIGTVVATLGIGGAAFAFAAKDTIANLYGSLALALDRPFKVGDWIMVGDRVDGDVEEIGLRSTKVRTFPKTVLSIPNSVLANEYINNWTRMPKRRVKHVVGVTYETSPDEMEGIVEDIRAILREDEGVQQDFMLVNFTDFGASSLDILVYYFTQTTAWREYMDVRQRINVKIMRAVEARGLSIAFPTRTLYFEGDIARQMGSPTSGLPGQGPLPGDAGPSSPP